MPIFLPNTMQSIQKDFRRSRTDNTNAGYMLAILSYKLRIFVTPCLNSFTMLPDVKVRHQMRDWSFCGRVDTIVSPTLSKN